MQIEDVIARRVQVKQETSQAEARRAKSTSWVSLGSAAEYAHSLVIAITTCVSLRVRQHGGLDPCVDRPNLCAAFDQREVCFHQLREAFDHNVRLIEFGLALPNLCGRRPAEERFQSNLARVGPIWSWVGQARAWLDQRTRSGACSAKFARLRVRAKRQEVKSVGGIMTQPTRYAR